MSSTNSFSGLNYLLPVLSTVGFRTREIRNLANSPTEHEDMEIERALREPSMSFRIELKPRVTGVLMR